MASANIEQTLTTRPATEDDGHYEVVGGRRVETPRMGTYETDIANTLKDYLGPYTRNSGLGKVVIEMLFRIDREADLQRRPDLAYVSYQRWPKGRRPSPNDAWDVVPDLAVEVVSPTNTANDVQAKVQDYFRTGVRLVLVVYPKQRQVYVYTSATAIRVLQVGDDLDGGAVVPEFRLPLATLFEDEAAPPPP